MGSCVSRSPASSASTARSSGRSAATAKVVCMDGSMTQYAAPVTAREALGGDDTRLSVFLCSSDELRFDAPPRALANEEELQPGWLYFVLPVSMLRLALSGHEMAALAVRASSALAVASSVASPPRRKNLSGTNGKQRRTARVVPLVISGDDEYYVATRRTVRHAGDVTAAGKARKSGGYRSRGTRRRAATSKLSPILEADDF